MCGCRVEEVNGYLVKRKESGWNLERDPSTCLNILKNPTWGGREEEERRSESSFDDVFDKSIGTSLNDGK